MDSDTLQRLTLIFRAVASTIDAEVVTEEAFAADMAKFAISAKMIFPDLTDADLKFFEDDRRSKTFITLSEAPALVDANHKPWVAQRWREPERNRNRLFWTKYRERLFELDRSPKVIADIDAVTDAVLDGCGDPLKREAPWQRRGMVIGEVQSGKTGVFAGLMNKAADAGYKVIVVLAGMLNNLREQTQRRLDEDFVGSPSTWCAVGDGNPVFSLTTADGDFKATAAFRLATAENGVVLAVLKKNKDVLESFHAWLTETKNANLRPGSTTVDSTLLLIDDEADSASVNTNAPDKDATAVNFQIRRLLNLFRNASYVGFTATPYANIFIDPFDEDGKLSDLFPKNFIRYTKIPSNYFGVGRMLDAKERADADPSAPQIVRTIEDAESKFGLKHKKTLAAEIATPGWEPPASLVRALRQFLVANALLDLRGLKTLHRTMMVNVSRFTGVQDALRDRIAELLLGMTREISLHARSRLGGTNREIEAVRAVFEEDFGHAEFAWKDVRMQLPVSVEGIKVCAINQTSSDALRYDDYKESGLRVVAVGGLTLSRGLTLEGLCVSYLYRSTATYDTLTQMGRWFGYRPHYEDLCRIWLSETTYGYFARIADAMLRLQSEVAQMEKDGKEPKDFGLKVLKSPDALAITSRNKMRNSREITVTCSFSAYFTETSRLPIEATAANKRAVQTFLERVAEAGCPRENWRGDPSKVFFREVPKSIAADFVRDFSDDGSNFYLAHYDDRTSGMANFIETTDVEELQTWDVAIWGVRRTNADENPEVDLGGGVSVHPQLRPVKSKDYEAGFVAFERGRISGPEVEEPGLTEEEVAEARSVRSATGSETEKQGKRRTYCRRTRRRPLLVLMPVRPNSDDGTVRDWVPAYALSFCAFDEDRSRLSEVSYRVNRVWIERYLNGIDDEGDTDE